jgi:8-oxo-dGTP diphosphatase
MRAEIRTLVDEITPLDSVEADHRLDALRWHDSAAEIFRTATPATPPKHLVAYCVLVDTAAQEVLLIDHRDTKRWLPTGGHVEIDEHPRDTARREMFEELHVAPEFHPALGAKPLTVTVTRTQGHSVPHTDVSLWFVFEGLSGAVLAPDATEFAGAR